MSNETETILGEFVTTSNPFKGILVLVVAVIGFGTTHVPIRRFPVGDGMFVEFVMSVGIIFVGFAINAIERLPEFQTYAAIGGFLWAIG